MIIVTYQVKDTMNYHPIQLILELGSVFDRILPYCINTDKEIA